jgi:hypothetical protein
MDTTLVLYNKLHNELIDLIKSKKIEVNDAITLVVCGIKLVDKYKNITGEQKTELLMMVLEDIAKGTDGKFGTQDDLISECVWNQIKTLMTNGIIQSTIKVIHSLIKGSFPNIEEITNKATGCCRILLPLLSKK